MSDFDEVFDNTDPTEPCFNTLDPDGDGINSYFENTTGCNLAFIGISNGSTDIWVTDYQSVDTDNGGVDDRTEYFDSTNPENDPSDDILPDDFDNDGIPDAVENATGSDWRNPDTDGGGMLDGAECPQQFWFFNCVGAPFNLFDPTEDLPQNEVIFCANNTTGVVDLNIEKYWRKYTNDIPTGNSYTHDNAVHPGEEVVPPFTNLTHMASTSFANDTITWQISYNFPVGEGALTLPASTTNVSFWADSAVILTRTNDTHRYELKAVLLKKSLFSNLSITSIGVRLLVRASLAKDSRMRRLYRPIIPIYQTHVLWCSTLPAGHQRRICCQCLRPSTCFANLPQGWKCEYRIQTQL